MESDEDQSIAVQKVYPYGTTTSIPDFDVCRLSFYLKCCTLGCNMMPVAYDQRVIDFERAQFYSSEQQYLILELVLTHFNLTDLIEKVIFLDEERRLLPAHVCNAFFDLDTARHYFPVQPAFWEQQGESSSHQAAKPHVMLCTLQWINDIYIKPVLSLQKALVNVPSTLLHIIRTRHCVHCQGMQAECSCDAGCKLVSQSCCQAFHQGIQCSECRRGFILGARYQCSVCEACNLCETCYHLGEHDQCHSFELISRPQARSKRLPARVLPLTESGDQIMEGQEHIIPTAIAVPIEEAVPCDGNVPSSDWMRHTAASA